MSIKIKGMECFKCNKKLVVNTFFVCQCFLHCAVSEITECFAVSVISLFCCEICLNLIRGCLLKCLSLFPRGSYFDCLHCDIDQQTFCIPSQTVGGILLKTYTLEINLHSMKKTVSSKIVHYCSCQLVETLGFVCSFVDAVSVQLSQQTTVTLIISNKSSNTFSKQHIDHCAGQNSYNKNMFQSFLFQILGRYFIANKNL